MRNRRLAFFAAGVVLLVLLVILLRRGSGGGPEAELRVTLEADAAWVPILSRVKVRARVTPPSAARERSLQYIWSAADGTILGAGPEITWLAPGQPGTTTIMLDVFRASAPTSPVHAELRMEVVDMSVAGAMEARGKKGYEITAVELDKERICSTGDVRVRISATDPTGDSQWLVPIITFPDTEAISGFDVIGRVSMSTSRQKFGRAAPILVELFDARSPQAPVATRTVDLMIEDCPEARSHSELLVTCFLDFDEWNVICRARHRDEDLPWFRDKVRSYTWRLEEGGTPGPPVSTTENLVVLPIPDASMVSDRAVHTWIVHASAVLDTGQVLEGRGSVSLTDTYFANVAQVGKLLLLMTNGIGWVDGGAMYTPFRIRNQYPEAVVFEEVELEPAACTDEDLAKVHPDMRAGAVALGLLKPPVAGAKPAVQVATRRVPALSVLGTARLPAASAWHEFIWKVPLEEGICLTGARILGYGEVTGLPIELQMLTSTSPDTLVAMEAPVTRRERDAARILTSELGRPVYRTHSEDLARLEQEGKLRPFSDYVTEWKAKFGLGAQPSPPPQ